MKSRELLNELLALFGENIPSADFLRAYQGAPGSRLPQRPVVTGEVDSETVKPSSEELKLRFRIYLTEQDGLEKAEELFAAMCKLCGESYPGFSAISRGAAERDKATGLLTVVCSLSFLTQGSGGSGGSGGPDSPGTAYGVRAILGGKEYTASGVKTSMSSSGKNLISIGETEPFAVLNEETEYTVELEGIETAGLDRLAGFTAEIGEGTNKAVYLNCRWKQLSDVLRKAVFVSAVRE